MVVILINTFGAMLLTQVRKTWIAPISTVPVMVYVAINHQLVYVGNNYYCESAHKGDCWVVNRFFPDDPLWDGQQCENDEVTCCTPGTNTPPWFSVDLLTPQVMISRCVFVMIKTLQMKTLQFRCRNSMSSNYYSSKFHNSCILDIPVLSCSYHNYYYACM
jgi:hypothetical protein